jgi:hypothetical protein
VLTASVIFCYNLTAKSLRQLNHPITISFGQPKSVEEVPFPAITFFEVLKYNRSFFQVLSMFKYYRQINKIFDYVENSSQLEERMTDILACNHYSFVYDYPFKGYERSIVPILRNRSIGNQFWKHKALWNSQYEVALASRLTWKGFANSFNVLDVEKILRLEE